MIIQKEYLEHIDDDSQNQSECSDTPSLQSRYFLKTFTSGIKPTSRGKFALKIKVTVAERVAGLI